MLAAPFFGVKFVADPTLLLELRSRHDKFGAACFTRAVFSVAVLSEVAPFIVAAGESMLVVEAHPGASFAMLEMLQEKVDYASESTSSVVFLNQIFEWMMLPGVESTLFQDPTRESFRRIVGLNLKLLADQE